MSNQICRVELGARSYEIHIEPGCLSGIGEAMNSLFGAPMRCLVVSNETVGPLYLNTVRSSLRNAGWHVSDCILPDGERFKTITTWSMVLDALMVARLSRNEPVIALGGGVVGDITGFAAACYRRGIPYIQVPTTLLAQVDSSVGGKTAVSHADGKNMIGAFYQPRLVWIDPEVLQTLAATELRAGLAEAIKYGAIRDRDFFDFVRMNAGALLALNGEVISRAIMESCRYKAEIVMRDETEQGARALLNLGHTFGHAIEAMTHYTEFLHGEAVAIGMCMAARLSEQRGDAPHGVEAVMVDGIAALGLPVNPPQFGPEQWLDAMGHDKKNIGSHIRYILLHDIGQAFIAEDVKDIEISGLISSYK